jgi:speckle-type POZ protein
VPTADGNAGQVVSSTEALQHRPAKLMKARASFNGNMQEMTETGRGLQRSVMWRYKNYCDPKKYYDVSDYTFASYIIILEFQDTSFAEGERHVLTHLSKLLDTQSMADVTFVVKNEKIGAHSAIVVSASPVICAMLEKDKFLEGVTKEVKIDDIDPAVFKEMLRYLYTGKTKKMDEDMAEPLFLAADKYQIEGLKDLCEQSLIMKLTIQTVVHYLVLAHLYTAPQLLEVSLKFLVSRKKEISTRPEWKELIQSYPDLFFLATNRIIG